MMILKDRFRQYIFRFFVLLVALQLLVFPFAALANGTPPTSTCNSYLLADVASGDILIANKPEERIYPASTTKIMTALLLLENEKDLSKTVTVGNELDALDKDASKMGLKKGEIISYHDLLYGLMLPSGGDAALTIAVHIGGSIEGFAAMMNAKAAQLGMSGTHFVNPHGLHDENHYSTAADLAKLTIAALANSVFRTVVDTPSYTTAATNKNPNGLPLTNTNKLISTSSEDKKYNYAYAIGVKTGYTDPAHGCLVAAAQKDGQTYVAVMLGDTSTDMVKRFTDAAKFFDYGFTQKRIDLYAKIKATQLSTVLPGDKDLTKLTAVVRATSIVRWLDASVVDQLAGNESVLDVAYTINPAASPNPTGSNVVIGTVAYSYQGIALFSCDIMKTPVEKPGLSEQTLLVSMILLSLAALLLIILIVRKVTTTRSRQNRRYSNKGGPRSSGSRLRNPRDYE